MLREIMEIDQKRMDGFLAPGFPAFSRARNKFRDHSRRILPHSLTHLLYRRLVRQHLGENLAKGKYCISL
jgi:hypothetical protein